MPLIDCQACGARLELPGEFPESARFVCARCGLISSNVESVRNFSWMALDEFTRRYGASRGNMIAGLIGASLWLPLLDVLLVVRNALDVALIVALALPYAAVLLALFASRARRPAVLYMAITWVLLGVYLAYLRFLFELRPDWCELVIGPGSHSVSRGQLLAASFFAVLSGAAVRIFYRLQAARLPKFGS
jgi:hypothetical protein